MAKSMTDYDFDICMIWDVPFDIRDFISDLEEDFRKENFEGRILFDFRNLAKDEDKRYVLGEFKNGKLTLPMDQLPDFDDNDEFDDYFEGDLYQEEADFLFERYGKEKNLTSASKPEHRKIPEKKTEEKKEENQSFEQMRLF